MSVKIEDLTIKTSPEKFFEFPEDPKQFEDFLEGFQEDVRKAMLARIAPKTVMDMHTLAQLMAITSLGLMGDCSHMAFTRDNIEKVTKVLLSAILATASNLKENAEELN